MFKKVLLVSSLFLTVVVFSLPEILDILSREAAAQSAITVPKGGTTFSTNTTLTFDQHRRYFSIYNPDGQITIVLNGETDGTYKDITIPAGIGWSAENIALLEVEVTTSTAVYVSWY